MTKSNGVFVLIVAGLVAIFSVFPAVAVGQVAVGQQGPAASSADDLDVAVLNLDGNQSDADLLETLTAVLRNEAQQFGSYTIVNKSPVNLSDIVLVLGCNPDNPACLTRAASQLDADVLIFGRVDTSDRALHISVRVFNATGGGVERRIVRTVGNDNDPVAAFRKRIQSAFQITHGDRPTRLTIDASVDGANVELNDTMVGTAPITRTDLPPGTYDVAVYRKGGSRWSTTVELGDGDDIQLWAPLSADSTAPAEATAAAGRPTSANPAKPGQASDGAVSDDPGPGADGQLAAGPSPDHLGAPARAIDAAGGTNWAAWSAVGVGAAALAGSATLAYLIGTTEDDLAAHDARRASMSRDAYLAEREDIVDTGRSYQLAHRVLLGVGAASAVAGTIWLIVDHAGDDQARLSRRSWTVGVSGRGVSARLRW